MEYNYNSTFKSRPRKPLKRSPFLVKAREVPKGDGKPSTLPPRKGLRKIRKDTVGKLKVRLWQLCREIIIQRYGSDCYTCPAVGLNGSNRHVGHFISSSVCSAELRYALENLRPQCFACNIHRSGNWPAYEAHLIRDGIDVEALKRRNQETKGRQYDILFYKAKIAEYELLLKQV